MRVLANLRKKGVHLTVHVLGVLALDQKLPCKVLKDVIQLSYPASDHLQLMSIMHGLIGTHSIRITDCLSHLLLSRAAA
jgi:hypothetical protein